VKQLAEYVWSTPPISFFPLIFVFSDKTHNRETQTVKLNSIIKIQKRGREERIWCGLSCGIAVPWMNHYFSHPLSLRIIKNTHSAQKSLGQTLFSLRYSIFLRSSSTTQIDKSGTWCVACLMWDEEERSTLLQSHTPPHCLLLRYTLCQCLPSHAHPPTPSSLLRRPVWRQRRECERRPFPCFPKWPSQKRLHSLASLEASHFVWSPQPDNRLGRIRCL